MVGGWQLWWSRANHFSNNDDGFFNRADNDGFSLQDLQERRRAREERGFQRLKQLKWQTGYTMPQHYRSDRYKVDYDDYNLHQNLHVVNSGIRSTVTIY